MKNTATATKKTTAKKSSLAGDQQDTSSETNSFDMNDSSEMNDATAMSGQDEKTESQAGSLLEKLFIDLLKDIYGAEQQLVAALQKMCDAATTDVLQSAFEDHLYVTQKHAKRLEKVFSLLGKPAEAKTCEAMAALIKEGEQIIENTKENTMTRDAGLIIAAQKVEHYEIAAYGSLVQIALTLDHAQVASILEKTLWEEEDTDSLLTEIAETEVNPMADTEDAEETEEVEEVTPETEA